MPTAFKGLLTKVLRLKLEEKVLVMHTGDNWLVASSLEGAVCTIPTIPAGMQPQ